MKKRILFLLLSAITLKQAFAQSAPTASASEAQSTENVLAYIRRESVEGALDFKKILAKDEHAFFLQGSVIYSRKDFAIFLWGNKVKALGLTSPKKAKKLWEELYAHSLTSPEERALLTGFHATLGQ